MRIDEMIMKANEDGKTYVNQKDEVTYSAANGFNGADIGSLWNEGWEEKPKRHLTVQEAEKELDCVIDVDFSKLLRSPNEPPSNSRTVIILTESENSFRGYYIGHWNYLRNSEWHPCDDVLCWIDPEDILKLLPKQE